MIRSTVNRIGKQLEQLSENGVPVNRCFDILSRKARTIEELVVVEVVREVHCEFDRSATLAASHYAESSTRSARRPSMAFSR